MAKFKDAVAWIAYNDGAGDTREEYGDQENINILTGQVTVLLVADIFGKEPEEVADMILGIRRREDYFQ